ncbi:hypothetical protein LAY57_30450 [Argonema antarcticum A004/B2]|uniref:hypothetical protein n=1 Tax=Argonema antarcticum TaxID=2942763 RepID=UPI0030D7EC5B|nr:hypothetical protein [Argonema antarcticum A004/B2]
MSVVSCQWSVVSCQLSVVSSKNQDFQSNHWQFLVVSYFRHPALALFYSPAAYKFIKQKRLIKLPLYLNFGENSRSTKLKNNIF